MQTRRKQEILDAIKHISFTGVYVCVGAFHFRGKNETFHLWKMNQIKTASGLFLCANKSETLMSDEGNTHWI